LTPERWRQVERIFHEAAALSDGERAAFLNCECASDPALREEVESLLAVEAGNFLKQPAAEIAAQAMFTVEPVKPGNRIGPYEIVSLLGSGGMGQVYQARDTRLNRTVALKVLPAYSSGDAAQRNRLLKEARAASALNHPNVVTLHDIVHEDGRDALVLEYVAGQSLRQRIRQEVLPLKDVLNYAIQIADALAAAHAAGIIHRDIKPGNIMINDGGMIKVLDFGLAKQTAFGPLDDTASMTAEGVIAGTIAYMSPEQARGEEVDARSDLYSFGVVLYEMATGKLPFPGSTSAVIFEGILSKAPVPPRQLSPQLPETLEQIIAKTLKKDRNLRAQTATELRSELEGLQRALLAPSAPLAPVVRPARRTSRLISIWLAAALGTVVVALAGWHMLSGRGGEPSGKNATFTQLTDQAGQELYPSLSPDGKSFVYSSRSSGNWDIYFQRVGGKAAINLTKDSPADDTQPAFSPDGERIVFRSEREGGGIFLMGATGESVKRLTDFGYNPAWSPDGTEIVCATAWFAWPQSRLGNLQSQLFRVNVSTGEERLITPNRPDAVQPHWSPHGYRLAFWGLRQGNRDIWTIPARGGEPVPVTNDAYVDWSPFWSPDGKYLYFSSDRGGSMNLWRVPIEEISGKLLGPLEPIMTPSANSGFMSLSRDGKRLAYVQQTRNFNVYTVAFDPSREAVVGQPVPITQGSRGMVEPDPSPDDQWLTLRSQGKQEDVFVSRTDGTGLRQLTDDVHNHRRPRWSPDGKRIAFFSNRGGSYQVWAIHSDGGGLEQLTYEPRGNVLNPIWSPDGSRLAYSIKDFKFFFMEVGKPWGGQSPQAGPDASGHDTYVEADSWSPDGRKLATTVFRSGSPAGIGVYSVEPQAFERLTGRGTGARWLSDGRRLLFADSAKLYLVDSRSKRVHEVLSVAPNEVFGAGVPSRDDRWIYFTLLASEADVWLMSRE
jgi:Tol biopolymer transport system component